MKKLLLAAILSASAITTTYSQEIKVRPDSSRFSMSNDTTAPARIINQMSAIIKFNFAKHSNALFITRVNDCLREKNNPRPFECYGVATDARKNQIEYLINKIKQGRSADYTSSLNQSQSAWQKYYDAQILFYLKNLQEKTGPGTMNGEMADRYAYELITQRANDLLSESK